MKKFISLIPLIFLISCSTVERHTYYTPAPESGRTAGPDKQYCGMMQFGREPDAVELNGLTFRSNQSFEPYLWGPWLITVVPVFPVTWVFDAFLDPDLEIIVSGTSDNAELLAQADIRLKAELEGGQHREVIPESVSVSDNDVVIQFPVEANQVESFILSIKNMEPDNIELKFTKTNRWAWTQHCIN